MATKSHPLTTSLSKLVRFFHLASVMDMFDMGPAAALSVLVASALVIAAAVVFFIRSAPPSEITISSGPEGSGSQRNALAYAKILQENGVKLKVLTSEGSMQNLERLKNPKAHVDVAMVQAGLAGEGSEKLVSLGSIAHQPLLIFYRGKPIQLLSQLKNKRIAIGPEGSGTNQLANAILDLNGIKKGEGTILLPLEPSEVMEALQHKKIDAAFVMSESAATTLLRALLHDKNVTLYSFTQVDAYVRKLDYLTALSLPAGVIDVGNNLPAKDIALVGPTVELVATKSLHPALSDLLLEAATVVHSKPGLFQHRGEFPTPIEHDIKISEDASRYYKSGKSFFYRFLPYWLASLLSRVLVVFVPAVVVLIPATKTILGFFRWRVKAKIYQRYRQLLLLERSLHLEKDSDKRSVLRANLDRIEDSVSRMRVKGSYADQVYGLRGHIDYVRKLFVETHSSSSLTIP